MEKSGELLALQKEADALRADFSLLRNQFLTERKKAEKQVAGLKEALKTQRSQLEKNLLVSVCCPGSLEKTIRLHGLDTCILLIHCFIMKKINYPSTQALTQWSLLVYFVIIGCWSNGETWLPAGRPPVESIAQ